MKLTNETEARYQDVIIALGQIGLKVPVGVKILSNIVGICNDIADGITNKEIINKYNLGCKEHSFSALFRQSTGVSVLDIPKMEQFDKQRRRLIEKGYGEEQIKEILEVLK